MLRACFDIIYEVTSRSVILCGLQLEEVGLTIFRKMVMFGNVTTHQMRLASTFPVKGFGCNEMFQATDMR